MNPPSPFSQNQYDFFLRCFHSWLNVAEGGKRGGKNVLLTMAFCANLEKHPGKLHLIAGVSTTTAKLNILDCDGFGLLNYFEGRCRTGQYQKRDCLYVKTQNGEKIILVSGGGKKGDEKLIKGNTYASAYITEANECHPLFIQEVFDRTLSSANRRIFHDLNPKSPNNWYYSDVLNFHERQQKENPAYGYNYGHFTIADNMSISDDQLRDVLKTYDKKSVWYKRDILGNRCVAEGLVYQRFADSPEDFIIADANEYLKHTNQLPALLMIGIDFGGNKSATSFKGTIITQRYKEVIIVSERHIHREIDPDALNHEFVQFVREVTAIWGPAQARADNEETVLIRGLRNVCLKERLPVEVKNAIKGPILNRIRLTNFLFAQNRIKICKCCEHMIGAFANALYDNDAEDVRLDDGTSDIDSLDAYEYSLEPHAKGLETAGFI